MSKCKKTILLSAFGINSGGGVVLLEALMVSIGDYLEWAMLDSRLLGKKFSDNQTSKICYVKRNFVSRISSLFHLGKKATSDSILFCFNSLPPLVKPRCKVVVFVQAPHFADLHFGISYNFLTSIRIWIERLWFKFGIRNCEEIWVQTSSMANAIKSLYPNINVLIMPFVDESLLNNKFSDNRRNYVNKLDLSQYSFFYPADAVAHKNHINLIRAWVILNDQGYRPKLLLTLSKNEFDSILENIDTNVYLMENIRYLGRIPRVNVLDYLKMSSALIFPSLAETFGLPMLEAGNLSVPIIASERDFVWDVCTPTQTFDPGSPRSIARAVRRFMNEPEVKLPLRSASFLIDFLIEGDSSKQ